MHDDDRTVDSRERESAILTWYRTAGRDLPWRRTTETWYLLLAETILRRTRVTQAEPVMEELYRKFRTPRDLAAGDRNEIEEIIRPVGLPHRADQVHEAARAIVERFGGETPSSIDDLLTLPGVGPYVAAAVSAAAAQHPVLLTDTNTVRVSTRVAGVHLESSDIRRQRVVQDAIAALYGGPVRARVWWATIDLAHALCLARDPECGSCPLALLCSTGRSIANRHTRAVRSDS